MITAASAPCSARLLPTRARLDAESSPAIFQRMGNHRRRGLGGPRLAPRLIERIGVHGLEFGAGLGRRRAQALQGVGAVQARVIADGPAGLAGLAQIGRHPAVHQIAHLEQAAIHLVAHLQGVAAIHEDRRLVLEDHRRPGRAGEAGGPGQAVVGRRQIFVLVLVLVRDRGSRPGPGAPWPGGSGARGAARRKDRWSRRRSGAWAGFKAFAPPRPVATVSGTAQAGQPAIVCHRRGQRLRNRSWAPTRNTA